MCSFTAGSEHLDESTEESMADSSTPLHLVCTDNHLGSPVAPAMTLPGLGVLQGPRPGLPSLQPPPGMSSSHLPPFLPTPNMAHMPPQMVPGGPIFASDRFRIPMPFPSRSPPFHRHPSMGPESMDEGEGRHFRDGRPGFGCPTFQRARW